MPCFFFFGQSEVQYHALFQPKEYFSIYPREQIQARMCCVQYEILKWLTCYLFHPLVISQPFGNLFSHAVKETKSEENKLGDTLLY